MRTGRARSIGLALVTAAADACDRDLCRATVASAGGFSLRLGVLRCGVGFATLERPAIIGEIGLEAAMVLLVFSCAVEN